MGFLVVGAVALLGAVPILGFPKELPRSDSDSGPDPDPNSEKTTKADKQVLEVPEDLSLPGASLACAHPTVAIMNNPLTHHQPPVEFTGAGLISLRMALALVLRNTPFWCITIATSFECIHFIAYALYLCI